MELAHGAPAAALASFDAYLASPHDLVEPLTRAAHPRALTVATDISAIAGTIALVLLVLIYVLGALDARRLLNPTRLQGAY